MDDVVRTPDDRFVDLPDYEFEPHYVTVHAKGMPPVRMHFVDAGPADGKVVLLLHGQPTWSYLYRKVIPVLTAAGLRAIAPDHIGFGRSDKPTERTDYTLARHIEWLGSLIAALDLTGITLVAQDWGGPIGLSALAADSDRFARVVAANTVVHTADPSLAGRLTWANHGLGDGRVVLEEALVDYLLFYYRAPDIVASFFVDAVAGPLPPGVLAAYDAPFPNAMYKAGLRQLTGLMPLTRNDPGAAIGRATMSALASFDRPFLTAYSDGDPATAGWESVFQERIPGAYGQPHIQIAGAGHFLQEQKGEELGRVVADFIADTPAT
jgi:haloalkane dehalogenase